MNHTFQVDLSSTEPLYEQPEILQHPMIPAPIAGLNPRTVLGQDWWDKERRAAYAYNNFCCLACAGNPDDDPFVDNLEAHECYDIDWRMCTATYTRTVALCWRCHNFIHAGRLRALYEANDPETSLDVLRRVLEHGETILRRAGLTPYWKTYILIRMYVHGIWENDAIEEARRMGIIDPFDAIRLPDSKWRLIVYGKEYRR